MRDGQTSSRSWRFRKWRLVAGLGAVVVLVLAAGALVGFALASWRESARVVALRARIDSLEETTAGVRKLALQLETMEADYERLRRVMGGDVAPSRRDLSLPELAPSEEGDPPGAMAARDSSFAWPLARRGFTTRGFLRGVNGGVEQEHPGLDIAVPTGSYVLATRAGRVEAAGRDSVYGLFVRLRHPDGTRSLYGHASWLFVATGDSVELREVIALTGSTGRSTAPHLHFELRRDGRTLDPTRYFGEPDRS